MLRRVALIVRNSNAGSALLSQRSREAFSSCACATPRLILQLGSKEEAAPFGLRRFQRQKPTHQKRGGGNDASQSVSIAKPSMVLSYESLETSTGSSNSLRSTIQSVSSCPYRRIAGKARMRGNLWRRLAMPAPIGKWSLAT